MASLAVVTGKTEAGSVHWRHELMWRQLSALWQTPVRFVADRPPPSPFSVVISEDQTDSELSRSYLYGSVPVVVFLEPVEPGSARREAKAHVQDSRRGGRHTEGRVVLRLESAGPLVSHLPKRIELLGPRPNYATLEGLVMSGEVLVSADGRPVIVERDEHLLVGASPWQLGSPTMPYLYPILRAWLSQRAGLAPRTIAPLAAFRFDDLPAIAHEVCDLPQVDKLDRKRAKVLGRLRRYALKKGIALSFAYSTHFPVEDGLGRIADRMPRSIAELRSGLSDGVIDLGSHGMVHLRNPGETRPESQSDHREFIDLDESATENHIVASKEEFVRVFGKEPRFFVAPGWAYRSGVTKTAAARHFGAVVDSSQHVESGDCPPLGESETETARPSFAETFRPGARNLNYTNPDFWRCYALAGIPIHYMQHGEVSRDRLLKVVCDMAKDRTGLPDSRLHRLVLTMSNARRPVYQRAVSALLIAVTGMGFTRAAELFLKEARCDIYRIMDAATRAGYRCVAISTLQERLSLTT